MLNRKTVAAAVIQITFFCFLPVFVYAAADAGSASDGGVLPAWLQNVNNFVGAFANRLWSMAVVLTSVGAASMALIETAKNVFPFIHRGYHRGKVKWYLMHQAWRLPPESLGSFERGQKPFIRSYFTYLTRQAWRVPPETFKRAWDEMVMLAAAGNERALFNLPAEQIIGQISAAARMALDFPKVYPHLFQLLTGSAREDDLNMVKIEKEEIKKEEETKYVDARNRVFQHVQRRLDAMLISIKDDWTWWNRVAAVVLSVLLILAALLASGRSVTDRSLVFYFFAAVLGGFIAPVAKDLVASLERFRKK